MKEKVYLWIAWHMPRELVKWAFVRVFAVVSTEELSKREVATITCQEALGLWIKK